MMVSSALPDLTMTSVKVFWRGVSSVLARSSAMPSTPFIGVRISWLILARNSDLARSAASAWNSEPALLPRRRGGSPFPSAGTPRRRRRRAPRAGGRLAQASSRSVSASADAALGFERVAGARSAWAARRGRSGCGFRGRSIRRPYLRAGEHAEIAHDVARRPEQVAVDRGRLQTRARPFADRLGRNAAICPSRCFDRQC